MRPFLLVFLPLLVAYATALWWCVERWSSATQYFEHCWLVPCIGAFVLWLRRSSWSQRPAAVDRRGLWLLGRHLKEIGFMSSRWQAQRRGGF